MPLYEIECEKCGARDEEFSSVADAFAHIWPACRECGGAMRRVYTVPALHGNDVPGFSPYWSEQLSRGGDPVYVKSRDHKKALMKEMGVRPHEPGADQETHRNRQKEQQERRESISRAIDADGELNYRIGQKLKEG